MADPQSNARLCAAAGAPSSGVIHVRTRLTADFTVIANALAQRRGSAVTVGVAAYILSLPDGSPVSIAALCTHFTEGEILISRALRELEAAGYLERRRERGPGGHIRTRTYFHDVPGDVPDGPDGPPEPPRPRRPGREPAPGAVPTVPDSVAPSGPAATFTSDGTEPPAPLTDAAPQAVTILASLRQVDPRLILSGREAARLAPAVGQWLGAGVEPPEIVRMLTASLPDHLRARPAGILAFRLRETPLPPPLAPAAERPLVFPFQTCDDCDRAFRAPNPGRCGDCRTREPLRAAA